MTEHHNDYQPTHPHGVPASAEQTHLMSSVEARAARQAARIGSLAVDFSKGMRGRRRSDHFEHAYSSGELVLPSSEIIELGKAVRPYQPVLDEFSGRYNAGVSKESIEKYCNSSNRSFPPLTSYPPEQRQSVKDAMQRQAMIVCDQLAKNVYERMMLARIRREALKTIRLQSRNGFDYDKTALVSATDAIFDFGHAIRKKQMHLLERLGIEDYGSRIIAIGNDAIDRPALLAMNPALLKLVQLEQKSREEFWTRRHDAINHEFGDRLTAETKEAGAVLEVTVAHLQGLQKAVKEQ